MCGNDTGIYNICKHHPLTLIIQYYFIGVAILQNKKYIFSITYTKAYTVVV